MTTALLETPLGSLQIDYMHESHAKQVRPSPNSPDLPARVS
jgi:hypothetical protein